MLLHIVLEFLKTLLVPLLIVVPILYAWAAGWFLFFRLSRAETELRMKGFLDRYRAFLGGTMNRESRPELTKQVMHKSGARGWMSIWLPAMGIIFGLDRGILLAAICLPFFGGMFLGFSWYGMRCLRRLNLQSY